MSASKPESNKVTKEQLLAWSLISDWIEGYTDTIQATTMSFILEKSLTYRRWTSMECCNNNKVS